MRIVPCGADGVWHLWDMPNVLSQMLPAADFRVSVSVDLGGLMPGTSAGITMLGLVYSYLEVRREETQWLIAAGHGCVESTKWNAKSVEETDETMIFEAGDTDTGDQSTTFTLQAEVTDAKWVQYAVSDGDRRNKIGKPFALEKCVWTGSRFGLFARAQAQNAEGTAVFCGVEVALGTY